MLVDDVHDIDAGMQQYFFSTTWHSLTKETSNTTFEIINDCIYSRKSCTFLSKIYQNV